MSNSNPTAAWERNFREQMKSRRDASGMTQTDLAVMVKIQGFAFHQQTIQRIEAGSRPVRLDEAYVIAASLGSTLDSMVRPIDEEFGEAQLEVNRLRRRVSRVAEALEEEWETLAEAVEAIAFEMSEEQRQAGGEVTARLRWLAGWTLKALWLEESYRDTLKHANGISGEEEVWRDYPPYASGVYGLLPWLQEEEDSLWSTLPEAERPLAMAELDPEKLFDFPNTLRKMTERSEDGERPEAS